MNLILVVMGSSSISLSEWRSVQCVEQLRASMPISAITAIIGTLGPI